MDDASSPEFRPLDDLDLDKVAVGPYCVLDDFRPSPPSPNPLQQTETLDKEEMEPPLMSNDFPFSNSMRAPWLTSAADDTILMTSAPDDYMRNDWNEWMQWDPASQGQEDGPPLNAQGPVCYLKPGDSKPPIHDRRQTSQLRDASLGLQATTMDAPRPMPARVNSTPFTFGESIEHTPAFHFNPASLSSPPINESAHSSGFYPTPMWDQQHSEENTVYSPVRFEQHSAASTDIHSQSTPSLQHSPISVNNARMSSSSGQSSPEPPPAMHSKKRKSTADGEDTPDPKKEKGQPVKKTAHNMIEKRYRTNLNDKIAALRDSVPSLRVMSRANGGNEEDDDPEDLEGLTPAHKLNKATVLSKATEYIRHLEKRNKRLTDELSAMKTRMGNYEKMAISAPMALPGSVGTPDGTRFQEDPFGAGNMVAVTHPPQGMIPVPESMANLHRGLPPQPHYAPQPNGYPIYTSAPGRPGMQGPPIINGRRNNGMMGKLMVGSLAGLMIMEGLSQREQSSEEPAGRGLYALPFSITHLLTPKLSVGGMSHQLSFLPLAKFFLLFGALFYVFGPLLDFKPKPKKKSSPTILLSPVPSLASPVEVRRKAWLTAIQTVWVPQHNFILEIAALGLKMLKLSTRKVIGWNRYAFLTGTTKEHETARVKAWEIALDAQLTGGDAEISMSRLVLTIMASGTLPDTPARLMLKALHIRVLLWEVANAGYGTWYMFEELSAKLARSFWNAARSEHKTLTNLPAKEKTEVEPLPEHLAALLERECDEVLIDSIIQRAYNLAWNKPSADNTTVDESMDSVVEDFAIASPLDALAAWWSSHVLNKALVGYLSSKDNAMNDNVMADLELAMRTSPPTSVAQLRASVARAVLLDDDRSGNIAAAFIALPSAPSSPSSQNAHRSPRTILMNLVGDAPIPVDVRKALTLAKCLSLVDSSNPEARLRATYVVNNSYLPGPSLTLLSVVAAYKVASHFMKDGGLRNETKSGLERMVSSLRLWVGREAGGRSGLSNKTRAKLITHCLDINKTLVGMNETEDTDAGYHSQSDDGTEQP